MNTHGHQGPLTRYTKEDTEKFLAEETARSEAETAAYYAWKRGDQPLGTPPPKKPLYQPPDPETISEQIDGPISTTRLSSAMSKLLDDAVAEDEVGKDSGKVDIESVDVDDFSEEGREVKMKAMAEELEGFSVGQRTEAERRERERMQEGREKGREVLDQFGKRFEEPQPQRSRR